MGENVLEIWFKSGSYGLNDIPDYLKPYDRRYFVCKISCSNQGTVTIDINIIGASKMQNNSGAIHLLILEYFDSNFGLFSCKVIALNLLCFIFCINSFFLYFSFYKAIALPKISLKW